jgi:hypothetical protein
MNQVTHQYPATIRAFLQNHIILCVNYFLEFDYISFFDFLPVYIIASCIQTTGARYLRASPVLSRALIYSASADTISVFALALKCCGFIRQFFNCLLLSQSVKFPYSQN